MATVVGASAHRWVLSVLWLTAIAGCGGGRKAAPSAAVAYQSAPARTAPIGEANVSIGGGAPAPAERPGLGTTWGEELSAPVSQTTFERALETPWAEVALHYNDAEGVHAHAAHVGAALQPLEALAGGGALTVSLVDSSGRVLPGFHANGRALIVGADGERYRILVRNRTSARFEVVASVDGLDVIDGSPADPERRGYIIRPHGELHIDGFRTSDAAVAAFRFGAVGDSYAAQTTGDRNVGVIGFAIFAERGAAWTRGELQRRDTANPFPDRAYSVPPR